VAVSFNRHRFDVSGGCFRVYLFARVFSAGVVASAQVLYVLFILQRRQTRYLPPYQREILVVISETAVLNRVPGLIRLLPVCLS